MSILRLNLQVQNISLSVLILHLRIQICDAALALTPLS